MTVSRPRAAVSWSGGKDSCAALQRARASYDVVAMVTMFDEDAARSRSHGLRPEVLAAQADRLGLRRTIGRCGWETYDAAFSNALATLVADGITHVIFSDMLFEEHRRWAERICESQSLTAVEPLWGGERGEYHTVVTRSPLFSSPLRLRRHGHVQRSGCWALDLGVDDAAGA